MVKKVLFCITFSAITLVLSSGIFIASAQQPNAPVIIRRDVRVEVSGRVQSIQDEAMTVELQDDTFIILREAPDFPLEADMQIVLQGNRLDDGRIIADRISRHGDFDIAPLPPLPPVLVDISGQVESYDTQNGVLVIDGVTAILLEMPVDAVQVDGYLNISGELLPDGRLLIDTFESFQPQQFVALDATGVSAACHIPPNEALAPYAIMIETDAVPIHLAHGDYQGACDGDESFTPCKGMCNPLLITLSDAFSVPYDELAALESQGLGTGEIFHIYIVAEVTGAKVQELAESRRMDVPWHEILQALPRTQRDVLANRSILGNGRGQSIRVAQP